mmetsp:Transcript_48882/g.121273  ORF Transcript_48882/g.121273 Transcript_48882/m.121273 type:complete len:446 (+) Transcript_48882:1-1338(+)
MVRDKYGRKMSKSLGNVIDPLEMINGVSLADLQAKLVAGNLDPKELEKATKLNAQEYPTGIPECGSDALRFGLLAHTGQGRDINLDVARVSGYARFCNKLWNATRFAFLYMESANGCFTPGPLPAALTLVSAKGPRADIKCLPDAWILSKLATTVDQLHAAMLGYDIAAATQIVYEFWYGCLCDVYLEAIKPIMQLDSSSPALATTKHATQTVLHACLHYGLRMLHPFMPFVTEELFQRLQLLCGEPRSSIMNSPFPVPGAISAWQSDQAEQDMDIVMKIAASIRLLRGNYLRGPLEKFAPQIYIVSRSPNVSAVVSAQVDTICALAKSSKIPPPASVELIPPGRDVPHGCAADIIDQYTVVHIMLKGLIDFSLEVARLQKDLKLVEGRHEKLKKKMDAPKYRSNCPASQQEEDAAKLLEIEGELESMRSVIATFEANQEDVALQ